MLELVAIAEEDGWAFVRTVDGLVVVRPPYQSWSKAKATKGMVEQGVCQHGFEHAEVDFPDWGALILHLKQAQTAAWKKRGNETSSGREIEKLVHEMPAERLAKFLDRVETELFPQAQWSAAQNLLTTLLSVLTVRQDDNLNQRTVSLLMQCQAKIKSVQDASNCSF